MFEKSRQRVMAIGEYKLLMLISVVIFIIQLLTLRSPIIFGEPFVIANNLIHGHGYSFVYPQNLRTELTCFVPPLFVYIQVAILWLGLGARGIQVINLFFLHAAIFVIYNLYRKVLTREQSLFVFVALSIYVPFWLLAEAMEPNALNILLVALTLTTCYHIVNHPAPKQWVKLGILFGLQLAVRPDIIIGMGCFSVWIILWLKDRIGVKKTLVGLGSSIAISLLIVAPWTVRNYLEFGRFILVSANSGYNFYIGNNQISTGEMGFRPPTESSQKEADQIALYAQKHDQIDQDEYLMELGENWVLTHPTEAILLDIKKVYYHWWMRADIANHYRFRERIAILAFEAASLFMLVFGLYGLYRLRQKMFSSLMLTLFLYSTLVAAIFFVQSRHRLLKVDPFLLPMAVYGLSLVFVREKRMLTGPSKLTERSTPTMEFAEHASYSHMSS